MIENGCMGKFVPWNEASMKSFFLHLPHSYTDDFFFFHSFLYPVSFQEKKYVFWAPWK